MRLRARWFQGRWLTPSPTSKTDFPAAITIQGLLWLDENSNGLFETTEMALDGLFVNLRECENDRWKATTTTNAVGQYQFVVVDEGEYYIDFFKPNPVERYEFTIPKVAGNDDRALDSDVVKLDGTQGKSDCMEVKEGFNKLTNAGYVVKETPTPTVEPTSSPITKAPTTSSSSSNNTGGGYNGYCAFVDGSNFDFLGCSLPCSSPQHEDCPDGMLCALTSDCPVD